MKNKSSDNKSRVTWLSLGMMAFCSLWGFSCIQVDYFYFNQTQVLGLLVVIFLIYFVPYALIVGELGCAFRKKEGGVSSWIYNTIGSKAAYMVGWIAWASMLPYIAEKPTLLIISTNWLVNQNGDISYLNTTTVQLIGVVIFIVLIALATRGVKVVKVVASVGGTCTFILALLYIVLGIFGPACNLVSNEVSVYPIDFSIENFVPHNFSFIASLAIIILCVGGIEQVAPYVTKMKKPEKEFPKGIGLVSVAVIAVTLLGVIAMSIMFGQFGEEVGTDFLTNGQYLSYQKLGNYFGIGNTFLIIYAAVKTISDFALLMICVDAPLRVLCGNADTRFIPKNTLKTNKHGAYPIWLLIETIIVVLLLLVPTLGIGQVNSLVKWLIEINSICRPITFIFVFIAYIAYKLIKDKNILSNNTGFVFCKNKYFAIIVSVWCIFVTLFAICNQIYKDDPFQFALNCAIPVILIGLGFIMPLFAKSYNKR